MLIKDYNTKTKKLKNNIDHIWISHVGTFLIGTRYGVKIGRTNMWNIIFKPQDHHLSYSVRIEFTIAIFCFQSHVGTSHEGTSLYIGGPKGWELDHYFFKSPLGMCRQNLCKFWMQIKGTKYPCFDVPTWETVYISGYLPCKKSSNSVSIAL